MARMNETELESNEEPFSWEEEPGENLARLTMLAAEPVLSRIWGTPEEDAAWKHLEDEEDDASTATISGSEATMHRLWDTPEEDAAWKHLEEL